MKTTPSCQKQLLFGGMVFNIGSHSVVQPGFELSSLGCPRILHLPVLPFQSNGIRLNATVPSKMILGVVGGA